jgi:glutaredoxin
MKTYYNNLAIIFFILLAILLIKTFLETTYFETFKNKIFNKIEITSDDDIRNIIKETQDKINKAVDIGIREGFEANLNLNTNTTQISYLDKSPIVKIILFYKPSCKYCKDFMKTWNKIINNLPNNASYEEINTEQDLKKISQYKIITVPSIILVIDDEIINYVGNRSYDDINQFLRLNGVNLVKRTFEDFNTTFSDYINNSNKPINNDDKILNPHCPAVSFDKQLDINEDKYMYQIFNANGQYGYSIGGYNDDKLLTPFAAAYSTIDSYLSSLPDDNDPSKNSYKNIDECSALYANNIVNFGLCDKQELDNISSYSQNIKNGGYNPRVSQTDYSNNQIVVNAIKKVCNID